jgi:hypothetical protein
MSENSTPGPWKVYDWNNHLQIEAPGRLLIATVSRISQEKANAARIVACVNACVGIPTARLEAGVIADLLADAEMGPA